MDVEGIFYTPDELMTLGLRLINYTEQKLQRANLKTNQKRFKDHFGSTPYVCTLIWEDLQTTEIPEARVEKKDLNIQHFLMSMHFLKLYPKEYEQELTFNVSEKYGREKTWMWVEKIRGLKAEKLSGQIIQDKPG